jgi:type II secretory pathway component PulF
MNAREPVNPWMREYFSPAYKIAFLNAIHLRIQAGESLGRALSAVVNAERNPAKLRDMSAALQALEDGEPVSLAMARLGFFDSTVLAILGACDRSGIREAISSAAAHLQMRQTWMRQNGLVIFILLNELASAIMAPILLYTEVLPWIERNITPPSEPQALLTYNTDMSIAHNLTVGMMGMTVLLGVVGAIYIYRVKHLLAPTRFLLYFSDGAMAVGFKLAAAMLKAGVTIENVALELSDKAPGWARQFWVRVNAQLQSSVEPAQAMLQQGLRHDERTLLASHSNAHQLAETLQVLAADREMKAKRGRDLLLMGGTMFTIIYIMLSLGIAIWIYMTYNSSLAAGIDALSNGF